jgi:hypothetical protein
VADPASSETGRSDPRLPGLRLRSPLETSSSGPVPEQRHEWLADRTGLFIADHHAPPRTAPGHVTQDGSVLQWSHRLGRTRLMDLNTGPGGEPSPALASRLSQDPGRRTDVTHAFAVLRLDAELAPGVLGHLCPVNLRALREGTAIRCSMAQVVTDLVRGDEHGAPIYLLVPRSYGRYLTDALLEAGAGAAP